MAFKRPLQGYQAAVHRCDVLHDSLTNVKGEGNHPRPFKLSRP